MFDKYKYILFLGITTLFTVILIMANGVFYGWVDDVLMVNLFRGIYTPQPVYNPNQFIGIANGLINLYKAYPLVPWYGYFLYTCLAYAYLLIGYCLYKVVLQKTFSGPHLLFFCALMYSLLMQEFFQRNNFTTTACLLTGAGFCYLLVAENKRRAFVISLVAVVLGMLIRFETSVIIMLLCILFYILQSVVDGNKKLLKYGAAFITATLAILFVMSSVFANKDARFFGSVSFFEGMIEDAYLYPNNTGMLTGEDKLKLEAVISWNVFDTEVINEDYLKSLYINYHLTPIELLKIVKAKLVMAYQFSVRYHGMEKCFNWFGKNFFLLMFDLALCLFIVFTLNNKVVRTGFVLYFVIAVGVLVAVSILAKMEDRVLFPYLVIFTFTLISMYCMLIEVPKPSGNRIYFLLLPLVVLGLQRTWTGYEVSKLLREDLKQKEAFIKELNSFEDKIILFDNYTAYLLHKGPFENFYLTKSNEYILGFHYTSKYFYSIQNYFDKKCGTNKFPGVLSCLASQKERVVLAYWSYDVDFLQRWSSVFYKMNVSFQKSSAPNELDRTRNVFMWERQGYNYYSISALAEEK